MQEQYDQARLDACPDAERISAFNQGRLPDEELGALADHISACSRCQQTLDDSGARDTVVSYLRRPSDDPYGQESAFQAGWARVQRMRSNLAAAEEGDPLAGKERFGVYSRLEWLAAGGMGVVYKAVHDHLQKVVAIKVLPRQSPDRAEALARFRREMQALGALDHPHIVHALDAGDADGVPYLVMEYVAGETLAARVRRLGALPIDEAVALARQAASGLAYAHARGIIHRDVKPANLLCDGAGCVKILDLGVARLAGVEPPSLLAERLTDAGALMGSVDFLAPEQALDSRRADARSDIYSFGCTVFFLLTGRVPFPADTPIKAIFAHREQAVPSARVLRADVPESVAAVVARMMAKRPEDRLQSMDEVIACLDGLAVADDGRPLRTGPHAPRRSRRGPILRLGAFALVVAVAVGAWMAPRFFRDEGSGDGGPPEKHVPGVVPPHRVPMAKPPVEKEKVKESAAKKDPIPDPPRDRVRALAFGPRDNPTTVAWSPRGDLIACGFENGWVRLYDPHTWAVRKEVRKHPTRIRKLEWSPTSQWLAACHDRGNDVIVLWRAPDLSHEKSIAGLRFSWGPNDNLLAIIQERTLKIWNVTTGLEERNFKLDRLLPSHMSWSPDGRWLATSFSQLTLWNVEARALHKKLPEGYGHVQALSWRPDSRRIAWCNGDGVKITELPSAATRDFELPLVLCVAWSPDGKHLALVQPGGVNLHDAITLNLRQAVAKGIAVRALSWSPDSRQLVGITPREIIIWQVAD